jgi:para-aminobenzoate synthetase/4-amino-4-deoxychorismate lyase
MAADTAARAELEASAKDAAEHVMIVDLMRNDLGRVCAYGSVRADPPRVEPHAGVWQLVSTVRGRVPRELTHAELLGASFPPGSVTGAPKSTRRDAYTGAVGIASPIAGLDLSVAIRTFQLTPGSIWLGVGGGVVADSDPQAELAEALVKAAGALSAVGGSLAVQTAPPGGGPARPASRQARTRTRAKTRTQPARRALELGVRPDPSGGVFETLLAQDGRPQWLAAHLQRLSASVARLYGQRLQPDLAGTVSAAGMGMVRSRIRVLVTADGAVAVEASPEPTPATNPPALRLAPWLLPGGLGTHKWIDRRLLTALGEAEPATVPLLIDGDGTVLEAGWANVWIAEDRRWITPPADGRILPGVTRAALLANPAADTRVEPFSLERMQRADAIFLTSSVSGRRRAELAA